MCIDKRTANVDGEMGDSKNYLRAKIAGETSIRIIRDRQDISWDHQVHAINWFNSRFLFLYDFYNFLARRSVVRVGGVPVFKGKLLASVHGDEQNQRGVLLIVQYPSPRQFRNMLENTYFKLVSVVRAIAVQRFTFCLTHTVSDLYTSPITGSASHFGVHHFTGDASSMKLLLSVLSDADATVVFSSLKTHELATVNSSGDLTHVPTLMDGIILFECSDELSLRTLVASTEYQSSIKQCSSSFVGLFEQIP